MPENSDFSWVFPDAFLQSTPSQPKWLYVELSELFFGFCMLLAKGFFFMEFIVLWSDLVYYSDKGIYIYLRYVYYYPSSGTSILLVSMIDGFFMGKNLISETSVMTFTYFQQHGVPYLQNHQGRERYTTDQRYSPFLLLLNHSHILKHIPLIPFMIWFNQYIFQIWIFNLYRSNFSDSV